VATRRRTPPVTFDTVRDLARALPEVEDSTSWGGPSLKVRGKLIALRKDQETLAIRTDFLERETLVRVAPDTFFFTDHYRNYPWVLVRLGAVEPAQLAEMLEEAWRRVAPKSLVKAFDAELAERNLLL
jgi:hypothetical protein